MTRLHALALAGLLLFPCAAARSADGEGSDEQVLFEFESASEGFDLSLVNRLQVRFSHIAPEVGGSLGSFDVPRYKLILKGRAFGRWNYRMQTDIARGSEDDSELLEDAYVQYNAGNLLGVRIGQGKVAFGRQFLTSSGSQQFVDRSIASERFAFGRDVGVALVGHNAERTYSYDVGVYSGSGINKDEDDNEGFLAVARLNFTIFGAYELAEGATRRTHRQDPLLSFGVAALSNTTGTEGIEEEHYSRGALEFAYTQYGLSLVGEFFSESVDPVLLPESDADGWYFQAGYLWDLRGGDAGQIELAGRYSEILPEAENSDQSEKGVAVSYYRSGHRFKLQADYSVIEFQATPFMDEDRIRLQFQIGF